MKESEILNRYHTGLYKGRYLDETYQRDVLFKFGNLITNKSSDGTGRILDLACGDGKSADYLEDEFGLDTVRVDLSVDGLRLGRGRRVRALANQLPFPDGSLSGVHMKDALVHILDKNELFEELARVLLSKGVVLITSANSSGPRSFSIEKEDGSTLWVNFSSPANYMDYAKKCDQNHIRISPPYYPVYRKKTLMAAEKAGFSLIRETVWVPQDQSDWYYKSEGWVDRFVLFLEKAAS